MPSRRASFADLARRAAMLASVFLSGAIGGYVAGKLDLLDPPPAVAAYDDAVGDAAAGDTVAADATAGAATDGALAGGNGERSAGGDVAPPAAAPLPAAPPAAAGPRTPLGEVAVGLPARDARTGATSPLPTRPELVALREVLEVPVAGVARDALPDTFHERRGTRPHDALDILAPRGTPVLSAADGTLRKLFTSDAGGLMIYASDASGRFILGYAHLDRYADGLREGMPLRRGQPLGTVGTTGNAPPGTPHLHFFITRVADPAQWWRGTAVDPRALLRW
jgi:murein DD-endopeptidase MepM/ murein hydrolase activator NlpD